MRLAAAVSVGDDGRSEAAMARLHAEGRVREVEEVLLQSYLFAGYPRALNALALWRRLSGEEPPPASGGEWPQWEARGEEVCRRVYDRTYAALRRHVSHLHPDLDRWMVAEGYGKVLGRPGLDLKSREMCAVASLAAVGAGPQLHAHLRGVLNAGAACDEVERWVRWLGKELPADRAALLREMWEDVRARRCS